MYLLVFFVYKIPKSLIWIEGFKNEFYILFKEIKVYYENWMAYKNIALYFTLIEQRVYEIITN